MLNLRKCDWRIFLLIILFVLIVFAAACDKNKGEDAKKPETTAKHTMNGATPTPKLTDKNVTPVTPSDFKETASMTAMSTATATSTPPSTTNIKTAKSTPTPTPTATAKPTPTATPNKYNGNINFTTGKIIQFSHPSGYYASPFTLKLNYDPSYKIYYTLNGNTPTTSAKVYQTAGIAINDVSSDTGKDDDVIVVRAAAFRNGKQVGNEVAIVTYGHENGNWFYKIDEGTESDLNNYKNMLSWIANNNMASSTNYNNACKMLDMDNFIKYIAVNVFANNRDWPHNNVRAWKYTGSINNSYGQDGKWRFMLKDIDYSWGIIYSPGQTENVVAEETAHSENVLRGGAGEISAAFASLMRNTQFKAQFKAFIDEMVNKYFSESTASAMITKMKNAMAKEYSRIYTNIWYKNPDSPAQGEYRVSLTYDEWQNAIETLYEFARKRPAVIKNLTKAVYG